MGEGRLTNGRQAVLHHAAGEPHRPAPSLCIPGYFPLETPTPCPSPDPWLSLIYLSWTSSSAYFFFPHSTVMIPLLIHVRLTYWGTPLVESNATSRGPLFALVEIMFDVFIRARKLSKWRLARPALWSSWPFRFHGFSRRPWLTLPACCITSFNRPCPQCNHSPLSRTVTTLYSL